MQNNQKAQITSDQIAHAVADVISSATVLKLFDVKQLVEHYVKTHLEHIILMGLGIRKSSFHGGEYEFERVNGFSGELRDFVLKLASDAVDQNIVSIIQKIKAGNFEFYMKNGLSDAVKRTYLDAYESKMFSQIQSHMKSSEEEELAIASAIDETALRAEALLSPQIKSMFGSMK